MADASRYAPVGLALPGKLPAVTRAELEKALPLVQAWALKKYGPNANRRWYSGHREVRRCWVSPRETSGHLKGWGRFVHDVSHSIFHSVYPDKSPHNSLHATYEREVAEFVAASGWLAGKLKPRPKAKPEKKPVDKLARVRAAIARWESKERRARNALAKLRRSESALVRAAKKRAVDESAGAE